MLSYGRRRSVILEAPVHDKDCVLANTLVAHFLSSSEPSRVLHHLRAAEARLVSSFYYFRPKRSSHKSYLCGYWRFLWTNCLNFSTLPFNCCYFEKDHATSYERAVFDAISCLISKDRDDDVAVELHAEVLENRFFKIFRMLLKSCSHLFFCKILPKTVHQVFL